MRPSLFGPPWWLVLHYAAWKENGSAAADLLLAVPLLLPCRTCRESAAEFLHALPPQPSPFHATVALHSAVNKKLGIRDPFEDMAEVLDRRFSSGAVLLPMATVTAALAMTREGVDMSDARNVAAYNLAVSALRRALGSGFEA